MSARSRLEQLLPFVVLAVLLWYSFVWFVVVPYTGFAINTNTATIVPGVFTEPAGGLLTGDQIVSIGDVTWEGYSSDLTQTLLEEVRPGDIVPFTLIRNGERMTVQWEAPVRTTEMIAGRAVGTWWFGYIFWLAGTVTVLMLRPKDLRWRLLIPFFYLTAIWLVAGSGPSSWQAGGGAMALRVAVISSIPVYLHLHWVFPQPLARLPRWLLWLMYGATAALILLQLGQLISRNAFYIGFALAVMGSIALLFAHLFLQRSERRSVWILFLISGIALAPVAALLIVAAMDLDPYSGGVALLGLPLIPFAYVFSVYRQQVAGMGLRLNRLLASYLYVTVLIAAVIMLATFVFTLSEDISALLPFSVILALAVGWLSVATFGPYQRLVERLLFGRPPASADLPADFSARIATSLDREGLVNLLRNELSRALLVEQSALLLTGRNADASALYHQNVEACEIPTPAQIGPLAAQGGRYRPPLTPAGEPQPAPWVRLILPLKVEGRVIGLWLLGRRAPDDIYSPSEIPVLQALANQTAVALTNIIQAESLSALYQANIDQHEQERARIAREIHDDLLQGVVRLQWAINARTLTPQEQEAFDEVVGRLRKAMAGLRPGLLNFGLGPALRQLVEEMERGVDESTSLRFEVKSQDERYPEAVEQHVYRIVQEAMTNACRHAGAQTISLRGALAAQEIRLAVSDDGKGFVVPGRIELVDLLSVRHYGIWQMFERADLIGAELRIRAAPGVGAEISIHWRGNSRNGA